MYIHSLHKNVQKVIQLKFYDIQKCEYMYMVEEVKTTVTKQSFYSY